MTAQYNKTLLALGTVAAALLVCALVMALLLRPRACQAGVRGGSQINRRLQMPLQYHTYLLTLPSSTARQANFFKHHPPTVPLTTLYGQDTKKLQTLMHFKPYITPRYFEFAVDLLQKRKGAVRPDHTYFDPGAVGCYFLHMDAWHRALQDGHKYALVVEDNVTVSQELYEAVNRAIEELHDGFEALFLHCSNRVPHPTQSHAPFERLLWVTSTKCYLLHMPNFQRFMHLFKTMDAHVDLKFEDVTAAGGRVLYKNMKGKLLIFKTASTIQHTDIINKDKLSRHYPITRKNLKRGTS